MRARAAIAIGTATLVLAPAAAADVTIHGKTEQGLKARVTLADNGQPRAFRIVWRAPCGQGTVRTGTTFMPPFVSETASHVVDGGKYTAHLKGYRLRVKVNFRARREANGNWHGVFGARGAIKRHGRVIDHCRIRGLHWSAAP